MRRNLGLAIASLFVFAGTASAQLVYDNGGPNQQNGNEMTNWVQYNDFTLTTATTLGEVDFWSINDPAYPASSDGTVSWFINADGGGFPGANLFSGNAPMTSTLTNTGVLGLYDEYFHTFDLSVGLAAGTYWLGLHNGPLTFTARSEFYWETTDPTVANGNGNGEEDPAPFANSFNANGQDHAFALYGPDGNTTIPEPGTMTLLATGLTMLGATRRRRRA